MKKIYLLSVIAFVVMLSSCKKESSIGADILPQDDLLNVKFSDTFSLFTKTVQDTFLRTDKLNLNYLGVINDPQFGFQKASIVMELDKPNAVYDDTLMTTYSVDSVVLFLKYNSVYGDTTVPQSFEVSTISNKINENLPYYSNSPDYSAVTSIGSLNNYLFTPTTNPVHISTTDSIGVAGLIRVKLNSSLGNTIIDLGQNILRDSALFKNSFPGIRIENSTTSGNAMAEINSSSTFSSIVIFYKDKYGKAKDMRLYTSLLKYVNGTASSRVNGINLFSNNLNSTVQNTIASGQQSDSINYVLGQGGTLVKLSLPTLGNIGRVAVNKAILSVTQLGQNTTSLDRPLYLVLIKRNANGNLDILSSNDGVGILDTTSKDALGNNIARYNFNITKFFQAVSIGTISNSDLYIATYRFAGTDGTINVLNSVVNGTSLNVGYTPSRIVVAGSNYSDAKYKMKLNLTYTVIN